MNERIANKWRHSVGLSEILASLDSNPVLQYPPATWRSALDSAFWGAIAGAVIGVIGTLTSQFLGSRERREEAIRSERERREEAIRSERERREERAADRRQQLDTRREEFLFRALEHFGGGTQERSIGIAIAEAYWKQTPDRIDVLVPLLLNQLVYLLAVVDRVKSTDSAHERQNVRRIIDLLTAIDDFNRFRDAYASTLLAVEKKPDRRGLDLTPDPEIDDRVSAFLRSSAQRLRQ